MGNKEMGNSISIPQNLKNMCYNLRLYFYSAVIDNE
jgi:hypothetical protein